MRIMQVVIIILFAGSNMHAMEISSSAFKEGEYIPIKYTCSGDDVSPQLVWSNVPADTKSFAIIADDPDAPVGTWVHWVLYNIPANKNGLSEDLSKKEMLSDGTVQGINDFKRIGYGGPCPPPGKAHRYYFKLYALDILLERKDRMDKTSLLSLIEDHILEEAKLMGKYSR